MKKLLNLSLVTTAVFALTACSGTSSKVTVPEASKLDVKKVCSVENNGIAAVLATAKTYNSIAQKKGLEFRRLGVNNSGLIASVEEAIKTGAKEVNPKDFKGKKSKTKLETNYAAWRSCTFAIRALQQAEEAKSSWRLAVPGDGYKY
jgi:hypothetical protein